jgi:hypothetical protein
MDDRLPWVAMVACVAICEVDPTCRGSASPVACVSAGDRNAVGASADRLLPHFGQNAESLAIVDLQ